MLAAPSATFPLPGERTPAESSLPEIAPSDDWQATCEAIALLSEAQYVDPLFGVPWRARAAARLQASLNRYLCPKPELPTDERTALALIKSVGLELEHAGKALDAAAYHLREGGQRQLAGQVKQAASRAHQTAQGLLA